MQLRVLTFNLLYAGADNPAGSWSERLPLVLDVLRSGADVVALQEATHVQLRDIEHALGGYGIVPGPESGETRMPRVIQSAGSLLRRVTRRRQRGRHHAPPQQAADASPGRIVHAPAHPHPQHPHAPHAVHPAHPVAQYTYPYRRGEHCAILYRTDRFEVADENAFWLSHEPDVSGSVLPWSWLPRVVNWVCLREREGSHPAAASAAAARSVMVYNAHLDFLPWSPVRSARILRAALDAHWDGTPQILMGDFNAAPNSAAYRHLSRDLQHDAHPHAPHPPLMDAWLAAAQREGPEGTYHGGTGRVRWMGRLDRILFRPDLEVQRVATVTHQSGSRFPSDHYPVLAELRMR